MERNAIQWLGAPCCLRGSFAFYKSFRCGPEPECRDPDRQDPEQQDPDRQDPEQQDPDRQDPEQQDPERQDPDRRDSGRPARVWRLGEFYFIRCSPQDPVCVAELALLWEDRAQRHLLASSRLYFLPEDTPTGRTEEHGEDEVLAVSKKIVLRVEDLVNWTCPEPSGWKRSGPNAHRTENCNGISPTTNSDPTTTSDPGEQRAESGPPACRRLQVKVLSYLQYCRFRSLQRRVQDPPALQDPHLLALGGVRISPHTLVLYCRDTFTHPTLDNSSSLWTQLGCTSLSLKGRPRKRRGVDGRERSPLSQSESWIEKMKENVMGSVEVPWEGGWLPHPEEQPFLDQLYSFMERRGSPISKVPNLGFKKIDLFLLFSVVKRLGGYERVTAERLWKQVYNELGGSPGSTSAATCTRRHYERLILAYEEHLTGGEAELSKPLLPSPANRSKELQKEKAAVANQRVKMSSPSGPGVRKRGRPPSRRNSKTAPKTPRTEAPPTQTTPTPTGLQDPSGAPGPEAARLGPFSPPKGLCPLELFRSRLGLSAAEAGPPSPALQPSPGVLLAEGGSRGPPPPLRVLPLDIGCSLQVRQLMRTRLGSAQLSSFAKRLTEVLAHDLSKARPPALATPPGPLLANQEQALPLNLSKRCGEKREGGGAGGGAEWREDDSSLALKRVCGGWDCSAGGGPLVKPAGGGSLLGGQDEPADLSCPRRARASLRQHNGQEAGPQCAPGPSPQPPLASGGDGGVAWDSSSDAGADCRGAE